MHRTIYDLNNSSQIERNIIHVKKTYSRKWTRYNRLLQRPRFADNIVNEYKAIEMFLRGAHV